MGDVLLTVNEAAARLAIGRTMLYQLIARQELRTVKIGRARRIPESALDDWIARQAHDSVPGMEADAPRPLMH
ncbi:MAG TPA: helix-turn-helix domain-containing protein [Chloroflexota bacterium]|nr:helix-turn-helix domain-containing protein [Chloroflexota bacterium]